MAKIAYTAVIERTPGNFSAYAPDLPGCVAAGATERDPPPFVAIRNRAAQPLGCGLLSGRDWIDSKLRKYTCPASLRIALRAGLDRLDRWDFGEVDQLRIALRAGLDRLGIEVRQDWRVVADCSQGGIG